MPTITKKFTQGIDQDIDPIEIGEVKPHAIYDAQDMRLINRGGKHYSYEAVKGNRYIFSVPDGSMIIGWIDAIDKLIVLCAYGAQDAPGEIGQVTFDVYGNGTYTTIWYNIGFNFGWNTPIRKMHWVKETELVERVYWTDNYNAPRVVNILDPLLTSMDIGAIDFTPKNTLSNMEYLDTTADGNLKSGTYMYVYRYKGFDGTLTNWSYMINPIQIADQIPNLTDPTKVAYRNYCEYQGIDALVSAGTKSINLQFNNVDPKYKILEVAYIYVTQEGVIGNGVIFQDAYIKGRTRITINHSGNQNLGLVTTSDLLALNEGIKTVGDIEISYSMMFIADIETTAELGDYDPSSGTTITARPYVLPCDSVGYYKSREGESGGGNTPWQLYGHKVQPKTGVLSGDLLADGKYVVRGTTGNIVYNSVTYTIGQVISVSNGNPLTFTASGDCILIACIVLNKFAGNQKIIELHDDFWDYKGTATSHFLRSNWRRETYRYGLLPYDLFGNPMFVRWIGDIQMPAQTDSGMNLLDSYNFPDITNTRASLRALGIQINNLDLTDIADKISGFSIVRAPRDKQILAQGIMYPIMNVSGSISTPMALNKAATDITGGNYLADCGIYHSPEFLFNVNAPNFLNGDKLRYEDFYQSDGGSDLIYEHTTQYNRYEKFYQRATGMLTGVLYPMVANYDIATGGGYPFPTDPNRQFINSTHSLVSGPETGMNDKYGTGGNGKIYQTGDATFTSYIAPYNFQRPITSYVRPKDTLYGGLTDAAKAATQYQFTGHYQEINASVFAANGNSWVFNEIDVFGGDCFVCLFDFFRIINDNRTTGNGSYSHAIIFPLESSINTNLRYGSNLNRDRTHQNFSGTDYNTSGIAINIAGITNNTKLEDFVYEDAYSNDVTPILYDALPVGYSSSGKDGKIVRHSNQKFNGELIDNFRLYLPDNFLDVDVRYGDISNLIFSGNKLYYLQKNAFGYLPIMERQLISDPSGGQTVLGTGGVLGRYDIISNFYGTQHFFSVSKFDGGIAWFDMRHLCMVVAREGKDGMLLDEVSSVKGLMSYFATAFDANQSPTNIKLNDNPFTGSGISAYFNPLFKEIHMIFNNDIGGCVTWVYNILTETFAWRTQNQPMTAIFLAGTMYTSTPKRPQLQPFTFYFVGDQVSSVDGLTTYICYSAFSNGSNIDPSTDGTHWEVLNHQNQVFACDQGDVCNFFGTVFNNLLQFIVSDGTGDMKYWDNLVLAGNDIYGRNIPVFSEYWFQTTDQSAQDLNLDITPNKDYHNRDLKTFSNVPLDNRARLVDSYVMITLKKNNQGADLFTSNNIVTKIVSLDVDFRYAK